MTKITIRADCGNAPKKQLLKELNTAFARADVDAILALISEDATWHILGEAVLEGKTAIRQALEAMKGVIIREMILHTIITHGREGAVNGEIIMASGQTVAFCDIYQFASAAGKQIQTMTSYTIELNERA